MKDRLRDVESEADNEEESRNLQELFTREPSVTKSITHHHSHQNHACGDPLSRCEYSLKYDIDSTEARRRKKKSKVHHFPSCFCQVDFRGAQPVRTRNTDDIEAVMEKTERIFNDSLKCGGIKKSYSSPLSPKSAPRCHRNNGHSHCSKKTSSNCHRQLQQQRRNEENEKITMAVLNDIVNKGVANERIEYSNKYLNLLPVRSSAKKDHHWKSDQLSQDMQEYSDEENDCCVDKCCEDYHRLKKYDTSKEDFEMSSKRRENDWVEEDEEQRLQREYCELVKHKYDLCEHRKSKNVDDQRCKEEDSPNVMDQLERRRKFPEDETRRKKKSERIFTSKLPVPRFDSKSPNRQQTSMGTSNKNASGQRSDKNVQRREAGTSYHRIYDEADGDFLREEELRKELENIPYSKPCHRCTTGRNGKFAKSFEGAGCDDRNVSEKHEEASGILVKAGQQPTNEDLDLHASKSHILNLIDRALSKEFGPLDEKKNDQAKEEVARQELCIEISRALQGDCCHSLAQTLLNHRGRSDYVKHLKNLRWEYLNHIQDKLRKLYDLEKILDDCSSPRHSLSTLQSHASNTDQPKHCARGQISHQQEQKELTS
ncbi:hypothetical protein KPH14_010511 [Odynerus spinipes]|uniref:Uncharacterized protein n=1 Tax=Odynerus spinipes TaxID=1348599 RepID=A0AAD9RU11_9HYME|nr:hypothetical protein KPH14_010511 [Odynerus spinipes]